MNFYLQDPTIPFSYTLHEALLQACSGAQYGGGAFAFVSQDGVKLLLEDDTFRNFVELGTFKLIVGIDQITNVKALDKLKELRDIYSGLEIEAFHHHINGSLFHPKFIWFKNKQGGVLVVGSGNLTASGLRKNWEAFGVAQVDKKQIIKIEEDWTRWIAHSFGSLKSIDDADVIAKAESNIWRKKKIQAGGEVAVVPDPTGGSVQEDVQAWEFNESDEYLIAEIPRSGDRWNQANFDKDTFIDFFGAKPGDNSLRVLLRNVQNDGTPSDIEVRPSVSVKSQNYRFELEAGSGLDYPAGDMRPLGVFIRVSTRMFLYVLCMPTDRFYSSVSSLMNKRWDGRADRMKRVRGQVSELREGVMDLPLWNIKDED